MRKTLCLLLAICGLSLTGIAAPVDKSTHDMPRQTTWSDRSVTGLAREVRHELAMLPYFTIFDDLSFRVDGNVVTLFGQVTRPTLKHDAANVVKNIPGVEAVNNQIEVLPLSPMDDRIRMAEARAIYGYPALNRYAMGAMPPIHIIVKNGHVTLTGVVANEADKNIANIQANGVPGVFSVDNRLMVENQGAR